MSKKHIRSFVGIPINEPMQAYLNRLVVNISSINGGNLSLIPSENYHITLLFLDSQPPEWLDEFTAIVIDEIEFNSVDIQLTGIAPFPAKSPILLAAMIEENPTITQLYGDLKRITQRLGYYPENRRFTPHITLAKDFVSTGKHIIPPQLDENETHAFLSDFVLYESRSKLSETKYTSLHNFGFQIDDSYI